MENSLSPAEVIKFRAECHLAGDGRGVYSLYSMKSDLRKIFTEDDFAEHFRMLTKDRGHAGLKVVSESVKKNLAEVKYIEYINENGNIETFFSKTFLSRESEGWKILKEVREKSGK